MNTIAKSETTTVRLQKVCMAQLQALRERLNQHHSSDRAAIGSRLAGFSGIRAPTGTSNLELCGRHT